MSELSRKETDRLVVGVLKESMAFGKSDELTSPMPIGTEQHADELHIAFCLYWALKDALGEEILFPAFSQDLRIARNEQGYKTVPLTVGRIQEIVWRRLEAAM